MTCLEKTWTTTTIILKVHRFEEVTVILVKWIIEGKERERESTLKRNDDDTY